MIDDYVLDKVLGKIKEIIGTKKFDDTKILIDTDDKLPDYITFKNVVILMTCVVKNDDNFYPNKQEKKFKAFKKRWMKN